MAYISFTAGEAIVRGQLVEVQSDDSVRVYPANDPTHPPAGICFEDVASGSIGTFATPGTAQVYCIASGTIATGDLVVPPGLAPTTGGSVAAGTIGTLTSGSFTIGYAETDGSDGNPVYISFSPAVVN
jgi:hypothetical protein